MEETIDLKNVLKMIWQKRTILVGITIVALILGIIYSYELVKPKYTAKAQIVLVQVDRNQPNAKNTVGLTQSDVTVNDKIIATYQKLITNEDVLTQVIENTKLTEITTQELKRATTVSVVANTQILDIQITNEAPYKSAILANELAKVFKEKIYNTYGIDNVSITGIAETPEKPSNIHHTKDLLIFVIGGIVLSLIIIILINLLDNTIKTPADIEETLGLSILAEFPEIKNVKAFGNNEGGNIYKCQN